MTHLLDRISRHDGTHVSLRVRRLRAHDVVELAAAPHAQDRTCRADSTGPHPQDRTHMLSLRHIEAIHRG
jgi:hypothetical protein